MRTSRICGSWVLSVLLLGILGCSSTKKTPQQVTVKISGCKADPDPVDVYEGDTLTWTMDPPDGHKYTVSFKNRKPIPKPTPPIGEGQEVKKDFLCITGGWIDKACRYKYDIIQDDSTSSCRDPGVHIVP